MMLNDSVARTDLSTRLRDVWPVFVYLAVMAVLGIAGNVLVIIIYAKRPAKTSFSYFVVCLAILDLITSTVGMVCELVVLTYAFLFTHPAVYKILRFVNTFTAAASIWTLVVIAFDRYYKVCRPFQPYTQQRVKKLIILALFLGLLFSWPVAITHGISMEDPDMIQGNTTRSLCHLDPTLLGTMYGAVYDSILACMLVVCIILIAVPYCCILRHVRKHVKTMNAIQMGNTSAINTESVTKIFVAITIVYILSYIPMFVVVIILTYRESDCIVIDVKDYDPYKVNLIYALFPRFYFINSVANPFIYGIFNLTFRKECGDLMKNMKNRLCNCVCNCVCTGPCSSVYDSTHNGPATSVDENYQATVETVL